MSAGHRTGRNGRAMLVAFTVAALWGGSLTAAPYRPATDGIVLAHVAPRDGAADVGDIGERVRTAIVRARNSGDPRELGRADALLRAAPANAFPAVERFVLQGTIDQSLHRFDAALQRFDAALAVDPGHAQARLTRATVLQVRGRLAEAARDCRALARHVAPLVAATCSANVASLQGRAREAYLLLDLQLRAAGADVTPEIAGWSHAVLGGIAERLGRREDAARAYRAALAANPSDRFARVSLADLLLFDEHRSAEALRVVHDAPAVDEALALREAIARRALQDPRWREIASTLQARFDVARRRGESLHLREEALYWRELRQDPVRALDTARRNWSVQREPADARLLLDCARAVGDAATEAQARSWYRATGSALPRGDGENVTVVDPAPAQEGRS